MTYEYYMKVLKDFAKFDGRARRAEYWWFVLVNIIVAFVLMMLDNIWGYPVLYSLYGLAVIVPSIAVAIRRLHDTDKSGWWLLIAFVPIIGGLALLFFFVSEGTSGPNQFGPDPKGAEGDVMENLTNA